MIFRTALDSGRQQWRKTGIYCLPAVGIFRAVSYKAAHLGDFSTAHRAAARVGIFLSATILLRAGLRKPVKIRIFISGVFIQFSGAAFSVQPHIIRQPVKVPDISIITAKKRYQLFLLLLYIFLYLRDPLHSVFNLRGPCQ